MSGSILDMGARDLARAMARGDLSPVEVVDTHIAHIEACNPTLNAVVATRFEAARAEAKDAERVLRDGDAPSPLFGVPCTIKDFVACTDLPQTGGMLTRKDHHPQVNATVVDRLKDAGVIILGNTNAPEGGLWMETHNLLYGRTQNPWRKGHTPGGSSGGEGAIVACGGSPFGIGSDIGGSIRIPAAFCGTAGHKPSGRLVPNTGHFPAGDTGLASFLVTGPLGRRVEDLEAVMQVIAGPDGQDPVCTSTPWLETKPGDLRDVVVYPVESNGRARVSKEMRQAVRDSAEALKARGAKVVERDFPGLRQGFDIWAAMMSVGAENHYDVVLGEGTPIHLWRQLAALPFGRAKHTYHALLLTLADKLAGTLKGRAAKMVEKGLALQETLEAAMGQNGVILHPPYSRPAPRHHGAWRTPFDPACTAIFNVLEFPATHVPISMSRKGLPVGVQVVGARGHDGLTLAVAQALEADFGGWRRAPFGADGWA